MADRNEIRCSFCGKTNSQVRKIVVGPDVYICNECIDLAKAMIEEESQSPAKRRKKSDRLPKPAEIKAELDDYVIEQDPAKRSLAVAVYNHYKRIKIGRAHV